MVATLALAVLAGCTGGSDDVIVMQSDSTYWPWETSPPTSTPPPVAPAANATASISQDPTISPAPTETATPPMSNTPSGGEPALPSSEPPSTGAPGPTTPSGGNTPTRKLANDIVTLTNVEREIAGCPPASNNRILRNVASAHSADMAERNYFSHTNPEGEGPADRVKAAGYEGFTGENIAMGQNSAEAVVAAWMDSQDHRNIILNCESKVVGVGVADSPRGLYWTQLFGRV